MPQLLTFGNLRTPSGEVLTLLIPDGVQIPDTSQITTIAQAAAKEIKTLCSDT